MTIIISDWLEQMGGSQNANKVSDVLGQYWIVKPLNRASFGVQGTVNEYVATRLAIRLGLPVPRIEVGYLDQQVIDQYPQLAGFQSGYVLASQYETGIDLEVARQGGLLPHLSNSLFDFTSKSSAVGIMVGDTWLVNADRSVGSFAPGAKITSNEGNLYFRQESNGINAWSIRAIDYGHAFLGARWGSNHASFTWPYALLGTMRFFFEMGWLTRDIVDCQPELTRWCNELDSIDVQTEITNIVSTLPSAWVSALSTLSIPITAEDWQDLIARTLRHQQATSGAVTANYATVAARH